MNTKLEKPEAAVAGLYVPQEVADEIVDGIGMAGTKRGLKRIGDFERGAIAMLVFLSTAPEHPNHGKSAEEFFGLALDANEAEKTAGTIVAAIKVALEKEGLKVEVAE